MDETFTLLPIHIDPTSKAITSPIPSLEADLTSLHTLHRALLSQPNQIPPPPLPTNPKRSAQIQKMREQGNASLRTKTSPTSAQALEAIKLYTYGIEMALGRPSWEPSQLVREEAGVLMTLHVEQRDEATEVRFQSKIPNDAQVTPSSSSSIQQK
ncbi:translocation protein SEC72, partial [Lecanoromycetidae sp. Uapishka_2]